MSLRPAVACCSASHAPSTRANRAGCSKCGRCPQPGNSANRPCGSRRTARRAWKTGSTQGVRDGSDAGSDQHVQAEAASALSPIVVMLGQDRADEAGGTTAYPIKKGARCAIGLQCHALDADDPAECLSNRLGSPYLILRAIFKAQSSQVNLEPVIGFEPKNLPLTRARLNGDHAVYQRIRSPSHWWSCFACTRPSESRATSGATPTPGAPPLAAAQVKVRSACPAGRSGFPVALGFLRPVVRGAKSDVRQVSWWEDGRWEVVDHEHIRSGRLGRPTRVRRRA